MLFGVGGGVDVVVVGVGVVGVVGDVFVFTAVVVKVVVVLS